MDMHGRLTRTQTVVQSWPTFFSSPVLGSAVFQPVMSIDMYMAASAKITWKILKRERNEDEVKRR